MTVMLQTIDLSKQFLLHLQGGIRIPVLGDVNMQVSSGACVALAGPSGAGKTTLLRSLYGNYRVGAGAILVRHNNEMIELATASPRVIVDIRAHTLGYVSQFLRVVPRVAAIDIVAEAAHNLAPEAAHERARDLLTRLHIPHRLHGLPPATFSGGEQQRINLARGFMGSHPILLLDEPTASLDNANRDIVIAMIQEAKAAGTAIVGIFHDTYVRDAVADQLYHVLPLQDAA